jgi:imidazoleglycerol-phosphate dehydratase
MRNSEVSRKTSETNVYVKVNLDGIGAVNAITNEEFLDHMIKSLAVHSLIDITINASGDLTHHLLEDVAISLGEAILKALGDVKGIKRFGHAIVPMDCSLAFAVIDLAKRPYVKIDLKLKGKKIEEMPTENIYHFLETFAMALRANMHVWTEYGLNDHHKVEAAFKALALSLRQAITIDTRRSDVPSSKGVI